MSNLSDFLPGNKLPLVTRTSNVALAAGDLGKLIEITSGTFTQTFDACATLGDGWFVYLKNSGTGDITLDPAGSETIDGLTSYIMYPGEVRLIQCDGSVLRSVVLNSFYKVFESSGDFVKPPGYRAFEGLLWSGGNGGHTAGTQGGGGGGCLPIASPSGTLGSIESVIIGSGGVAGALGGDSSFAQFNSFGGQSSLPRGACPIVKGAYYPTGGGGQIPLGFHGGEGSSGGNPGHAAYGGAGGAGGSLYPSGNALFGGAGGGNSTYNNGGKSVYGGDGGDAGQPGQAPGGGGGGNAPGARGELRIWGII